MASVGVARVWSAGVLEQGVQAIGWHAGTWNCLQRYVSTFFKIKYIILTIGPFKKWITTPPRVAVFGGRPGRRFGGGDPSGRGLGGRPRWRLTVTAFSERGRPRVRTVDDEGVTGGASTKRTEGSGCDGG